MSKKVQNPVTWRGTIPPPKKTWTFVPNRQRHSAGKVLLDSLFGIICINMLLCCFLILFCHDFFMLEDMILAYFSRRSHCSWSYLMKHLRLAPWSSQVLSNWMGSTSGDIGSCSPAVIWSRPMSTLHCEMDRSNWLQWMHAIWTSQDICIKMVKMHHISFY